MHDCQIRNRTPYSPAYIGADGALEMVPSPDSMPLHEKCLANARRAVLASHVAPAAFLFVGQPAVQRTVVGLPAGEVGPGRPGERRLACDGQDRPLHQD